MGLWIMFVDRTPNIVAEKNSETLAVSDEQVASVKMLRARKRRIRQYSTELELKASEAHETRIRLEDELEKCADKSAALRLSLQSEEREVEAAQARTDEEVAEIVQETSEYIVLSGSWLQINRRA